MTRCAAPPSFMNGIPELLILSLLRQEEMYGYQLVEAIRLRTGQVVTAGEGVVYPVLHMLEQQGHVCARRLTVNGRTRIYYAANERGLGRLAALEASWTSLAGAVEKLLKGGPYGELPA